MNSRFNIFPKKVGLPPGHAVFTGEQRVPDVRMGWIRYGPSGEPTRGTVAGPAELPTPDPARGEVLWVNVDGLHDAELVKAVAERFGLHPLAVEDVLSVEGRPMAEVYEEQVFTSLKMLLVSDDGSIQSEHISLVFGTGWVLSFQETHGDVFDHVRSRLQNPAARLRSRGADYLWYALLDAIVDNYAIALSTLGGRIEALEDEVWSEEPGRDLPLRAQEARHELLVVRRAVRPLREQLFQLTGDSPALVSDATQPFLGDLEDHLMQHQDVIDHLRDAIASLLDAHVSVVSMRTNEVMRVLTVMASIFIPMTFVAGVYGMNFRHMPELEVWWAYPAAWAVMLGMATTMLVYFWRKKWL